MRVLTTAHRTLPRAGRDPASRSGLRRQATAPRPRVVAVEARPAKADLLPGLEVAPGAASDHHVVYELLQRVFRAPSADAFYASLDHPFYEPCDRLLARRGGRLIGHALLNPREMLLDRAVAPATQVSWLATSPEYRGQGVARFMLEAVDARLASDGSVVGVLTTRIPHYFARHGWALCARLSRYVAGARALLARLSHESAGRGPGVCIRPWRHVELPALVRLYAANLSPGMFARNEDTWRWLIGQRAFDQIYVATDSTRRSQLEDDGVSLAGYVITKGNDVLELMVDPARPHLAWQLLERVCSDAMEMDCHHLGLFAPPNHALTEVFLQVGGHRQGPEEASCEYLMAKVVDPVAATQWLLPQLQRRAEAARLNRPCELALVSDNVRLTILLTRCGAKLVVGKPSRSPLRLGRTELTRLFLGAIDVRSAITAGRVSCPSRSAAHVAAVLFPKLPLWRAPLDDLME